MSEYKRRRTLVPDFSEAKAEYWTATPNPFGLGFEYDSSALLDTRAPDGDSHYGTMYDNKSKGHWKYNDCVNVTQQSRFGPYGGTTPEPGALTLVSSDYSDVDGGDFLDNLSVPWIVANCDNYGQTLGETLLDPTKVYVSTSSNVPDYIEPTKLYNLFDLFSLNIYPQTLNISVDPLDTGFSIWFLIVDLLQLENLWRQLFNAQANLKRLRQIADDRMTAKQLADDHLAVSFGLLPTIQDLKDYMRIIVRWSEIYDNCHADLVKPRHWYKIPPTNLRNHLPGTILYSGVTTVPFPAHSEGVNLTCRSKVYSAKHHSTVSFNFECPEFHGWFSRLGQFIDALGILDPSALWDVVPFTFIVDWFLGIGNWLHKNRPKLFPAELVILDYCESIKIVRHNSWYATYRGFSSGRGSPTKIHTDQFLGTEIHTTYVRNRFTPPPNVITLPRVNSKIISLKRALISASLIAQRWPR